MDSQPRNGGNNGLLIGLIAGAFQMLMNVRPPKAKDELSGALPKAA